MRAWPADSIPGAVSVERAGGWGGRTDGGAISTQQVRSWHPVLCLYVWMWDVRQINALHELVRVVICISTLCLHQHVPETVILNAGSQCVCGLWFGVWCVLCVCATACLYQTPKYMIEACRCHTRKHTPTHIHIHPHTNMHEQRIVCAAAATDPRPPPRLWLHVYFCAFVRVSIYLSVCLSVCLCACV